LKRFTAVSVILVVNPLYVLPGDENVSVPLTPFNFQFVPGYGVLLADILFIVFGFLQRTIVEGLTAGAVKV
jgi:raffinose/stachyose/melibiose transport system permease protein